MKYLLSFNNYEKINENQKSKLITDITYSQFLSEIENRCVSFSENEINRLEKLDSENIRVRKSSTFEDVVISNSEIDYIKFIDPNSYFDDGLSILKNDDDYFYLYYDEDGIIIPKIDSFEELYNRIKDIIESINNVEIS